MNITLCIDIFENGSSNERLSQQVSEEYKHLNSGDMIDIEDYEFMISRKKLN